MDWIDVCIGASQNKNAKNLVNVNKSIRTVLNNIEAASLLCVLSISCMELLILGSQISYNNLHKKAIEIFHETIIDLRKTKSFGNFLQNAEAVHGDKLRCQMLKSLSEENSTTLELLLAKLAGNEKNERKELFKKEETIATLKDKVEDLAIIKDQNLRYIGKRGAAFINETILKCNVKASQLRNKLQFLTDNIDREERAHREVVSYLQGDIDNIKKQIQIWTEKYENEQEKKKKTLNNLTTKQAERRSKLYELKSTFDLYKREIDEYLVYKKKKEQEEERNRFIYNSATKIQSWWRGTMVRRGIGPYRKRKKIVKDKKK